MQAIKNRYFMVLALIGALAAMLATMFIVLAPAAETQSISKCFGKAVTQAGTDGPDVISGTFGNDVIRTFDGDDEVRGDADFAGTPEGGVDRICLGDGDDTADGADKQDFIMGGDGDDTLDGDNFPSPFRDNLFGEAGDDTFTGGQGNDRMTGGPGNDDFDPGGAPGTTISEGADVIDAGSGNDTATEDDGFVDTINCGPGTDTVIVDRFDRTTSCENKTVDPV